MPEPNTPPRPDPQSDHAQQTRRGRLIRNIAGFLLIFAAFADLLLPFLKGALLVLVGILLIDLPIKHRLHERFMKNAMYRRVAGWF